MGEGSEATSKRGCGVMTVSLQSRTFTAQGDPHSAPEKTNNSLTRFSALRFREAAPCQESCAI